MTYLHRQTGPQRQTIQDNPRQVQNSAGGWGYSIEGEDYLRRFLTLGTEGGTYYVDERKLTLDALQNVEAYIAGDWTTALGVVTQYSVEGRTAKVSPILFALALLYKHKNDLDVGNEVWHRSRQFRAAFVQVIRTLSHLYEFLSYVQAVGLNVNGSATLGKAVGDLISKWGAKKLAYQVVKYRQRYGWTFRDVCRVFHPHFGGKINQVIAYAVNGSEPDIDSIVAYESLKMARDSRDVIDILLSGPGASWEMIPTQFLSDGGVWDTLLERGFLPINALIRNLGRMTALGVFGQPGQYSDATEYAVSMLTSSEVLNNARVHPFNVLNALKTYSSGGGWRSDLTWKPRRDIVSALAQAYELSFVSIEPSQAHLMVAVDVSRSMSARIMGSNVQAAEAAVSLAQVFQNKARRVDTYKFNYELERYEIPMGNPVDVASKRVWAGGGTDCAKPMLFADHNNLFYDAFVIITDNETWAGSVKPDEALRRYRRHMNGAARLVVVGMTSTGFTIADPQDAGSMDVVGFDAGAFKTIQEFVS